MDPSAPARARSAAAAILRDRDIRTVGEFVLGYRPTLDDA